MSRDRSDILWPLRRAERSLASLLSDVQLVWRDANAQKAESTLLQPRSAEADKVAARVQEQHQALAAAEDEWTRLVDTLRLADEASRRCRDQALRAGHENAEASAHCRAAEQRAESSAASTRSARRSIDQANAAGASS